jgi:hypothetical protein
MTAVISFKRKTVVIRRKRNVSHEWRTEGGIILLSGEA